VFTGKGAQVQNPIRIQDGIVVMFNNQDSIPQIAQPFKRIQQAGVVARVQPNGRLVQYVQHTHQARADLRRQADALCFAARQRGGCALQREVIQPHIHQETQARPDFLQNPLGDFLLPAGERCLGT